MAKVIRAKDVSLRELEINFNLTLEKSREFFDEWREGRSKTDLLTEIERQQLNRIQEGYLNLIRYPPLLEEPIKMVILSPLLHLAGYYLEPFHLQSEYSVRITSEDDEVTIEGKIDFLLLTEQFWFMVIESKRATFSIEAGLSQILAYLLANPHQEKPCYGLITTGGSFVFLKFVYDAVPRYSLSKSFEIRYPDNEFYQVLAILKYLVEK
ncbi:MAG: restriction endonuclease subunit R [Chloroflexota bacterium]